MKIDGAGIYKLTYRFTPPEANGFLRHIDKEISVPAWRQPFSETFTFAYHKNKLREVIEGVERDYRIQRTTISPDLAPGRRHIGSNYGSHAWPARTGFP